MQPYRGCEDADIAPDWFSWVLAFWFNVIRYRLIDPVTLHFRLSLRQFIVVHSDFDYLPHYLQHLVIIIQSDFEPGYYWRHRRQPRRLWCANLEPTLQLVALVYFQALNHHVYQQPMHQFLFPRHPLERAYHPSLVLIEFQFPIHFIFLTHFISDFRFARFLTVFIISNLNLFRAQQYYLSRQTLWFHYFEDHFPAQQHDQNWTRQYHLKHWVDLPWLWGWWQHSGWFLFLYCSWY